MSAPRLLEQVEERAGAGALADRERLPRVSLAGLRRSSSISRSISSSKAARCAARNEARRSGSVSVVRKVSIEPEGLFEPRAGLGRPVQHPLRAGQGGQRLHDRGPES